MARKPNKPSEEKLFNPLKRKVLRKRIPRAEVAFGVGFVGVLGAVGGWVASQQDAFDPAERDLSDEALAAGSVVDTLYRRPLKPWAEPGSAPAAASAADLKGLPPDILEGGWAVDGRVESYDPDNLYEKINGAAELFLRFGFQELRYVTLAAGALWLTLEMYDQGAFPDALGLFDSLRDPQRPVESVEGVTFYRTSVGAIGRRGPYVFKISGSQAGDVIQAKTDQLIQVVASLPVEGGDQPPGLTLFTQRMGKGATEVSYEKQDVFQYAFMSDVWFAPLGDGEGRYFFHRATSAEAAAALFDQLVKEQEAEHELLSREKGRAVMKHRYLGTLFAVGVKGADLYGVSDVEDAPRAAEALAELEEALPDA